MKNIMKLNLLIAALLLTASCASIQKASLNNVIDIPKQNQDTSNLPQIGIVVQTGEVVASAKLDILVQQSKNKGISIKANVATTNVAISTTVPTFMTYNPVSTINFIVSDLSYATANGTITITIVYNDLKDATTLNINAYTQGFNGLAGVDYNSSIVPLKMSAVYTNTGNISPNSVQTSAAALSSSTPLSLVSFTSPRKAIKGTLVLKVGADFSDSIAQSYAGSINIDLVKN